MNAWDDLNLINYYDKLTTILKDCSVLNVSLKNNFTCSVPY